MIKIGLFHFIYLKQAAMYRELKNLKKLKRKFDAGSVLVKQKHL